MATPWIKIEHTLPEKQEVIQIAEILKLNRDAVVGKLVLLWIWADAQTLDGRNLKISDRWIDGKTGKRGFAKAMRAVGWLTNTDAALHFPSFDRHNGNTAKARDETNRRVAKHRAGNTSPVTDLTPQPLQKPLPDREEEEELSPPPASASVREVPDSTTLDQIISAYGLKANPTHVLKHIRDSIYLRNATPTQILEGTKAVAAIVINHAPSGWASPYLPGAEEFFRKEQWRSPEAFRHRWDTPTPTAKTRDQQAAQAAVRDRDGAENRSDWGGEQFR